jgi:hypothetical protein
LCTMVIAHKNMQSNEMLEWSAIDDRWSPHLIDEFCRLDKLLLIMQICHSFAMLLARQTVDVSACCSCKSVLCYFFKTRSKIVMPNACLLALLDVFYML